MQTFEEADLSTIEPTEDEIVSVVIGFLAELADQPAAEVQAALEEAGQELPVDSVLIVEILTRIEEFYGISIPADAEAARSTRSVRTFARAVLDAIFERRQS